MPARQSLHRLWQCLPQPWRRALLFRVTQTLAPRPSQPAPTGYPTPIIVAGFLTAATGLGEWARLALQAFNTVETEVYGIDLSQPMMQGANLPRGAWRDGSHLIGTGTLFLHVNAPYVPLALRILGKSLVKNKKIIGCWAWELPEVPPDWQAGYGFVHEVWALSAFTAAALKKSSTIPVKVTPLPVLPATLPAPAQWVWPKPADCFVVLAMFNLASGFTRKNPLGAIQAFQQAFGADPSCRLLLKVANPSAYPEGMRELERLAHAAGNIELLTATLPAEQIAALIAASDVVLSLHRAEGFGLVPAEAMLQGKPVVATGWSGNLTFMRPENSCLVAYRLVPAHDPQATYHHQEQCWAEPDIAAAAAALQRLRQDRAFGHKLGAQAQQDISAQLSLAAYAAHLNSTP